MPGRLLIVDDDPSLRELFRLSMEPEGFEVQEAEDGAIGLQKIVQYRPQVIVLDLMMPNVNGFQFLERMKSSGGGGIPVIVLTALSDKEKVEAVKKDPNVRCLYKKPILYGELAKECRRILGQAS